MGAAIVTGTGNTCFKQQLLVLCILCSATCFATQVCSTCSGCKFIALHLLCMPRDCFALATHKLSQDAFSKQLLCTIATKGCNLFHKALSKAHIPLITKPGEKGFEPLTFGFGNHYSTVETILLTFVSQATRANLYFNLVYGRTRTRALVLLFTAHRPWLFYVRALELKS